jgi:hypothetical protein
VEKKQKKEVEDAKKAGLSKKQVGNAGNQCSPRGFGFCEDIPGGVRCCMESSTTTLYNYDATLHQLTLT